MTFSLEPCPACSRHIKTTEQACPFCKVAIAPGALATPPRPTISGRLTTRAAVVLATAAAVGGCGKETKVIEPDAAPDAQVSVAAPPYGVALMPDPIPTPSVPENDGGPLDAGRVRHAPPYGVPHRGKTPKDFDF